VLGIGQRDRPSTGQLLELPVDELPVEELLLVDGVEDGDGVELVELELLDPDDELDELGVLDDSDLRESVR
jgi:hypothetical protein